MRGEGGAMRDLRGDFLRTNETGCRVEIRKFGAREDILRGNLEIGISFLEFLLEFLFFWKFYKLGNSLLGNWK